MTAVQQLAQEVRDIAMDGALPDGDAVNTPTLMWAESWVDRLAAIPEGWKLVPIVLDEGMEKAGGHVNSEWLNDTAPIGEALYAMPMKNVWSAMLDAAPTTPTLKEQTA